MHYPVFHKGLRFFSACGCGAKGPERRQRPIGTYRARKLHPADARLQLYAPRPLRLLAAISDILGVFVLAFFVFKLRSFRMAKARATAKGTYRLTVARRLLKVRTPRRGLKTRWAKDDG